MAVATLQNLAKLYVATFNRAPDQGGLYYWLNDSGLSIEGIAQSFFDQSETQITYPVGTSNTAFVNAVYANLFNRVPEQAGLDYWVHELDTGLVAKQNFILAVMNGAQNTVAGQDATILENKMNVGLSFANGGLNDVELARTIMADIDATSASVSVAETIIQAHLPDNDFFKITEDWLIGKTLYNVYFENDTTIIDQLTFQSNGNGVFASELYGQANFSYNVDANNVLTIVDPGGTSYIKAIEMDDTLNAVKIEWNETYDASASYQEGEWFEFFALDLASAEKIEVQFSGNNNDNGDTQDSDFIDTNFVFTSEWLIGKTLYDVYGDESGSNSGDRLLTDEIVTMVFNANGTLIESLGGQSIQGQWSVDSNNTIKIIDQYDTFYIRATGEMVNNNSYVVYSTDNYNGFSTNGWFTPEVIATDLSTAQNLIGTYIPADNIFFGM